MTTMISSYGNKNSTDIANQIADAIMSGNITNTTVWSATTNNYRCGGMNAFCKAIIHRALRRAGYYFYLAVYAGTHTDEETKQDYPHTLHQWGIAKMEEIQRMAQDPEAIDVVTGYSLCHAAHKLGRGNANEGWKFFHSF